MKPRGGDQAWDASSLSSGVVRRGVSSREIGEDWRSTSIEEDSGRFMAGGDIGGGVAGAVEGMVM